MSWSLGKTLCGLDVSCTQQFYPVTHPELLWFLICKVSVYILVHDIDIGLVYGRNRCKLWGRESKGVAGVWLKGYVRRGNIMVVGRGGYCGWRRIAIRYNTARAYCNTYCNILGILCTVIFRLPKLMLCFFGARISFMMFKNCIIKSWVYDHLMMTFCLQSLGDCSCLVYSFFP